MSEWLDYLKKWQSGLSWQEEMLLGLGMFLVGFFGSLAFTTWVLVKLPATYFQDDHPAAFFWADRHPALRMIGIIAKNMAGYLLIFIGIILSLPGVPGQGFLTILIGLMLLDFPGKRMLEKKIVRRPIVLGTINRLRERFGKPPLIVDEES